MKSGFNWLARSAGIVGVALCASGCVVAIGSGVRSSPPRHEPAPTPVAVTDSADAATIAEIDAARRLDFDNSRTHALSQIAGRPSLPVPVQVHLVNVTYANLDFENNKVSLLKKLIARPDFCDTTRQAIVTQLGKLDFDNNRRQILDHINDRLKQPSGQ